MPSSLSFIPSFSSTPHRSIEESKFYWTFTIAQRPPNEKRSTSNQVSSVRSALPFDMHTYMHNCGIDLSVLGSSLEPAGLRRACPSVSLIGMKRRRGEISSEWNIGLCPAMASGAT